jgi:hypothetical protein
MIDWPWMTVGVPVAGLAVAWLKIVLGYRLAPWEVIFLILLCLVALVGGAHSL